MKTKKDTTARELKRLIQKLNALLGDTFTDCETLESVATVADSGDYLSRAATNDFGLGEFTRAEQESAIEEIVRLFHDLITLSIDEMHAAFIKEIEAWFELDDPGSDYPATNRQYSPRFVSLWTEFIENWKRLYHEYSEVAELEYDKNKT
jgi:hypothetical protein